MSKVIKSNNKIKPLHQLCNEISDVLFADKKSDKILKDLSRMAAEDDRVPVMLGHEKFVDRYFYVTRNYMTENQTSPAKLMTNAVGLLGMSMK